jgi:hypothetical protein
MPHRLPFLSWNAGVTIAAPHHHGNIDSEDRSQLF